MILKLTKLKELEDAFHPHNIPEGYVKTMRIYKEDYTPPVVGQRYNIGFAFSTSKVQEIISEFVFKTYNSIYQIELTEEEDEPIKPPPPTEEEIKKALDLFLGAN